MVDAVMMPWQKSHCEEDVDSFLLNLGNGPNNEISVPAPLRPSTYQDLVSSLPDSVGNVMVVCNQELYQQDQALDHHEANVLAYICGYIIRKIRTKICSTCLLMTMNTINDNKNHEANRDCIRSKQKYRGQRWAN